MIGAARKTPWVWHTRGVWIVRARTAKTSIPFDDQRAIWYNRPPRCANPDCEEPVISIIVPTYNEAESLPRLAEQVFGVLREHDIEAEMVVVDDNSPDGTGDVAEQLAEQYPIQVLHRAGKLGLASAVIDGWNATASDIVGVMDADMSHDPQAIPALVEAIRNRGVELAVGSRYVPGGGMEDWPWTRQFVSWTANQFARPFTPIRDATSGFFLMRRSVVDGVELDPIGFKIGLEVMAKGRYTRWEEVPYVFTDRKMGRSKFGTKEIVNYLRQLAGIAVLRLRGKKPVF